MTRTDELDIPEFLRRQSGEVPCPRHDAEPVKRAPRRKKRPANWHTLTKAEQDGTADPATVALRKQLERDKKDKLAARFAQLRELAAMRKQK